MKRNNITASRTRLADQLLHLSAASLFFALGTHAYARMPIERAQREFQARYSYIHTGSYITWPKSECACDGGALPAPNFPADGFYGEDQTENPYSAAELVADLAEKFFQTKRIYTYYLQCDPEGHSSITYHDATSMPDPRPVTAHNYEEVLEQILNNLDKLTMISKSCSALCCDYDRRAYSISSYTNDCYSAKSDANSSLSWNTDYQCPIPIWIWVEDCPYIQSCEMLSYNNSIGKYYAMLYSYSAMLYSDLRNLNGQSVCFLKVELMQDGMGSIAPPVDADAKYHAYVEAENGGDWYSDYIPEDLPVFTHDCVTYPGPTYGWFVTNKIVINYPEFNTDADSSITCGKISCSSGSCSMGTVLSSVGSLSVRIDLGKTDYSDRAGFINLYAENPDKWIANPRSLQYAATGYGVSVKTATTNEVELGSDQYTYLRQIKVAQGLADIVLSNDYTYAINFYRNGDFSGGAPVYTINGGAVPIARVTITNPNGTNSANELLINEGVDTTTRTHDFLWNTNSTQWILRKGIPGNEWSEENSYVTNATGDISIRTNTVYDPGSNAVYRQKTVMQNFGWGETTVQSVVDPGGRSLTTTYEYYTNAATDGFAYRQLKRLVEPSGRWTKYEYSNSYEPTRILEQFLDAEDDDDTSKLYVTDITYTSNGTERIITRVRTLKDVEIERNYTIYRQNETVNIRCVTQGASLSASDNLVTTNYYYSSGAGYHAGRPSKIKHSDGTLSLYTYSYASSKQTCTEMSGVPNANDTSVTNGIKTVTVTGLSGYFVSSYRQDIATGIMIESSIVTATNEYGRPTTITYMDGTYETFSYDCCGLNAYRNREGIYTYYTRDDQGRATATEVNGITQVTAYTPNGMITKESRIGTDDTDIIQHLYGYNLAGEKTNQIDAASQETLFSEYVDGGSGHRITVAHYPDGSTTTNEYYQDGSLFRVSGTHERPRKYEYGVMTNGSFTKEISIGDSGEETEWVKRNYDMLGNVVLAEYPDDSTEVFVYSEGRLARAVDLDGVTRLYSYDGLGRMEFSAVDMNINDTIDLAGTDEISKTVYSYTANGITNVRSISRYAWPSNGVDVSVLVEESESSVEGLHSWRVVNGRTNSLRVIYDGNGGRIETRTQADGSQITDTYSNGYRISMTHIGANSEEISEKTFSYDAHGRLHVEYDARSGETEYTYDNADRITEVMFPAYTSGAARTSQEYTYDELGRVRTLTSPGGILQSNTYDQAGNLASVSGNATYLVEYAYDSQGRMLEMRTYQNAAVTGNYARTSWTYNSQRGFLDGKTYDDESSVLYSNTASGKIIWRRWARGVETAYTYDGAGRVNGITYSDLTPSVTNTYNRLGHLTHVEDGVGVLDVEATPFGVVVRESYVGGILNGQTLRRELDGLSRIAALTLSSVTARAYYAADYSYDGASRLTGVTANAISAGYTYIPNANIADSITISTGVTILAVTHKDYDMLNRFQRTYTMVTGNTVSLCAYDYDAAGRRIKAELNDGSYWEYGYDQYSQLTSAVRRLSAGAGIAGLDYSYAYDDIGNRLYSSRSSSSDEYFLNTLNQYTQQLVEGISHVMGTASTDAYVTVNNEPTTRQGDRFYYPLEMNNINHATSENANVVAVLAEAGPGGVDIIANDQRSFFVPQTPVVYSYDDDGNLLSDGRWTYTWDAENRLVAMETLSLVTAIVERIKLEYVYDGMGRRVKKTRYNWGGGGWTEAGGRLYVYDGWLLVSELDLTGTVASAYTWGLDVSGTAQGAGGVGGLLFSHALDSTNAHFFICDGNGNITEMINAEDGVTSAIYEYGPFGDTIRQTGIAAADNPFRFSTKHYDEQVGLYYYGYRYYSPELGRFINKDPIAEAGGNNLYAFVGNDPVGQVDVLGLADLSIFNGPDIHMRQPDYPEGIYRGSAQGLWSGLLRNFVSTALAKYSAEAKKAGLPACQLDIEWVVSSDSSPLSLSLFRSKLAAGNSDATLYVGHGIIENGVTKTPLFTGYHMAPSKGIGGIAEGRLYSFSDIFGGVNFENFPPKVAAVACCYSEKIPGQVDNTKFYKIAPASKTGTTILPGDIQENLEALISALCCKKQSSEE